jgi:hypothetical protein
MDTHEIYPAACKVMSIVGTSICVHEVPIFLDRDLYCSIFHIVSTFPAVRELTTTTTIIIIVLTSLNLLFLPLHCFEELEVMLVFIVLHYNKCCLYLISFLSKVVKNKNKQEE